RQAFACLPPFRASARQPVSWRVSRCRWAVAWWAVVRWGGRPVARWIVALPSGGDLIERREAPFEASRNAARFFSHGSGTGMWIASVLWQHDRRFGHDHRAGAGSAHGVTASDNRRRQTL